LGLGDITALNPMGRALTVFETATGFTFLAMIIGYMPLLEQAFNQRESSMVMLHSRTGSPHGAIRLLKTLHGDEHGRQLEATLQDSERWLATLLESHISHPLLTYYRSQHSGFSWLITLTMLLDTCAILIASEGERVSFQVKSTFRLACTAAKELGVALQVRCIQDGGNFRVERHWEEIRSLLAVSGVELSSDAEASDRFLKLRRIYEPYVMALGKMLRVQLPEWIPKEPEKNSGSDFLEEMAFDTRPKN